VSQVRGDMIEVFKITHNIYDPEVSPEIRFYPKSNTRGNKYKLLDHTFHCDTRKYSFSACIVNIWNSLPNFVVDVDNVCLFKARLDKFWMHQDVIYDSAADLTGIIIIIIIIIRFVKRQNVKRLPWRQIVRESI